ncbi:MAG TPA: hypothetical protein P5268_04335 [Candidatus Marinimicrobia bacterium]|nr:hypothetical protein [Candidatus Neomarinimicrobiota bacterium]HRS51381.1 hypothetical protein [Candidatus Neomarinimicrobiota bacterium]HRU92247.1 hypothetical protein [Candidatus Neomarinimicrobiota bacterium]
MKTSRRAILFLLVLSLNGWAQISYYANYGFGVESPANSVRILGMGRAGVAVRDSMSLNQSNPALWQGFGSTSLQGQMYASTLSIPELDFKGKMVNFSGFAFKLPVGRRVGLAIGLAPLTRMKSSVSFADSLIFQGDKFEYNSTVELSGGISELYLGTGYRVSPNLAVGLKAQLLFGNYVVRNHTEIDSDNDLESYYKRTIAVDGNRITIGLLLSDHSQRYNLAATIEKGNKFKSSTFIENNYGPDTTIKSDPINFPTIIKVGINLPVTKNLALNADMQYGIYEADLFQKFYIFQQFKSDSRNSFAVGVGLEKSPGQAFKNTFLQKLYYRGGAYYQTEPVYLNSGIREYGITAGISLPFFYNLNRMDFALTYGLKNGFLSDEIGNEKILNIHFCITTGEPWFRKYKKH